MAKRVSDDKRTRRVQDRAVKTREAILQAASEIIAEVGLHNIKSKDIAKRAKIPAALFSYHYPSMDALLNDLILQQLEKVKIISLEALQKYPHDPLKALLSYVRAPFITAERDKVFRAIVSYFYHMTTIDERYTEMNAQIRRIGRERILGLVSLVLEKRSEKLGKPALGLMETTVAIQGVMTGLFVMACTESHIPGQYDFKSCEETAVRTVEALIGR